MLARQRQTTIIDRLRSAWEVRIAELASEFEVSNATIRRDLVMLDSRGLLKRVRGGAFALTDSASSDVGTHPSSTRLIPARMAIAAAAAALVEPGMTVGISAGVTTRTVARHLADVQGLTIVTNSVRVADGLFPCGSGQTTLLTGGVRTPSDALVGPIAVAAFRAVHLDLAIVDVHGMNIESGFTCPSLLEAEADRALIGASRRLIVVADHSKWRIVGVGIAATLDEADIVITDAGLENEAKMALDGKAARLVVVDS